MNIQQDFTIKFSYDSGGIKPFLQASAWLKFEKDIITKVRFMKKYISM